MDGIDLDRAALIPDLPILQVLLLAKVNTDISNTDCM